MVTFLHGRVVDLVLDNGSEHTFFTRDMISDLLVLSVMYLQRGGAEGFSQWVRTSAGICEFIDEFQEVRPAIMWSMREMLVRHNDEIAFSHQLIHGPGGHVFDSFHDGAATEESVSASAVVAAEPPSCQQQ